MKEYQVTVNRTEKKDIRFRIFATSDISALAKAKKECQQHKRYWDSIAVKEMDREKEGRG